MKKKILKTVAERWRQFKSILTAKWALAQDKEEEDDTVYQKCGINIENGNNFARVIETLHGRLVNLHCL